jgi:predicted transcriptional regulator of viral defense system
MAQKQGAFKKSPYLCAKNKNMQNTLENILNKNSGFLKSNEISSRTEWRLLRKMIDNNTVTKVKRGLYRLNEFNTDTQMIEVAKSFPCAVFCLFTAWRHYELSTYLPFEFHIAIPRNKFIKIPDYPPVRVYYFTNKIHQLGITEVEMNGAKVKMYDLEKSVCDAIRFRKKAGIDTTSEILKNYLKRQDRDLDKLVRYAQVLRIEKFVRETITLML